MFFNTRFMEIYCNKYAMSCVSVRVSKCNFCSFCATCGVCTPLTQSCICDYLQFCGGVTRLDLFRCPFLFSRIDKELSFRCSSMYRLRSKLFGNSYSLLAVIKRKHMFFLCFSRQTHVRQLT